MRINLITDKETTADVHIRIRRRVVQVPVEEPGIRAIVPVPANMRDPAP